MPGIAEGLHPGKRGSIALAAVATAVISFLTLYYVLPFVFADSVAWQTIPLGLKDYFRFPGYLWPATVLAIFALTFVRLLVPRRLQGSRLLRSLGLAGTVLLVLIALVLVAWVVATPFSVH